MRNPICRYFLFRSSFKLEIFIEMFLVGFQFYIIINIQYSSHNKTVGLLSEDKYVLFVKWAD